MKNKEREIARLEFAILEIEMKDKLDNADKSLIEYYSKEIEKLKSIND
ncbi:hypothetical protein [Thomasclavelia ramosa]